MGHPGKQKGAQIRWGTRKKIVFNPKCPHKVAFKITKNWFAYNISGGKYLCKKFLKFQQNKQILLKCCELISHYIYIFDQKMSFVKGKHSNIFRYSNICLGILDIRIGMLEFWTSEYMHICIRSKNQYSPYSAAHNIMKVWPNQKYTSGINTETYLSTMCDLEYMLWVCSDGLQYISS